MRDEARFVANGDWQLREAVAKLPPEQREATIARIDRRERGALMVGHRRLPRWLATPILRALGRIDANRRCYHRSPITHHLSPITHERGGE